MAKKIKKAVYLSLPAYVCDHCGQLSTVEIDGPEVCPTGRKHKWVALLKSTATTEGKQ